MKFLLDHDVSVHVSRSLKSADLDFIRVTDILPANAEDRLIFTKARELDCVMVTCNRDDFLKLVNNIEFPGLIIIIRRNPPVLEGRRLISLINQAGEEGIRNNINYA